MAREKLRQLLSLSLVIIIMDIPIMEVMVTMDIMARGKLRQMLLLSPVITIMDILMEAMVIMDMDMDIMARERQSQDTITMTWLWLWLSWLSKQLFICSKTSVN